MSLNTQDTNLAAQNFGALHNRYHDRLLNSMTGIVKDREAAADITATAFASAFKNRARFRGQSSIYTWLYAIALNEASNSWRKNRAVSLESIQGPVPKELIDAEVPAKRLEHLQLSRKMQMALRKIPAVYGRVLVDHFIRERSVKQIARQDRVPVGTVLSRIFTAKRILRRAWED